MPLHASKALIAAALLILTPATSVVAETRDVRVPQISASVSPFLGLIAMKDQSAGGGLMLAQMSQISISASRIWIVELLPAATATQSVDLRVETAEGNLLRLLEVGSANHALQTQTGSRSYSSVSQTGQTNRARTVQSGSFQVADIMQSGRDNNAAIFQTGEYASAYIQQMGTGNTATVRQ